MYPQATVVYNKKNGKRALCLKGWGYAQYSGIPLTDSTIIKIVLQTYTRQVERLFFILSNSVSILFLLFLTLYRPQECSNPADKEL